MEERARVPVVHRSGGVHRTKDSMALETDVNHIMKRWLSTGVAPVGRGLVARYGDFTVATDYHAALNAVRAAQADFAALPAHIRDHVQNDPGRFLDMVFDPERRSELVELGMLPHQDPAEGGPAEGLSGAEPPPSEPVSEP